MVGEGKKLVGGEGIKLVGGEGKKLVGGEENGEGKRGNYFFTRGDRKGGK